MLARSGMSIANFFKNANNYKVRRYLSLLLAIALPFLILILKVQLTTLFGSGMSFMIFLIAVILSSLYGGWLAGGITLVLSTMLAVYFISPTVTPSDIILRTSVFVVESFLIVWIIGERKKQQEVIKESKARKQSIFEASLDSIFLLDHNGTIADVNQAAELLVQIPKKKLIKKNFIQALLPKESYEKYGKMLNFYLQKGKTEQVRKRLEIVVKTSTKEEIPVEVSVVSVRSDTVPLTYTLFLKDISLIKQREYEYSELLKREHTARSQAEDAIQARDEFLSIASHELKTPLTSMLLQLQTVLHSVKNVSLANFSITNLLKMLESTEKQSIRLSKMINDLLNVSLITTGKLDLELEEFDLVELVRDIIGRFLERGDREIKLAENGPVVGSWDKLRIEQVITNLLSNAIKYGDNKPIHVTVTQEGTTAYLIVKDHGIGIAQEKQAKIFERFERGVSEKEYKGLGVGLYICSQIVKTHTGSIELKSEPGNGSEFTVILPLSPQQIQS